MPRHVNAKRRSTKRKAAIGDLASGDETDAASRRSKRLSLAADDMGRRLVQTGCFQRDDEPTNMPLRDVNLLTQISLDEIPQALPLHMDLEATTRERFEAVRRYMREILGDSFTRRVCEANGDDMDAYTKGYSWLLCEETLSATDDVCERLGVVNRATNFKNISPPPDVSTVRVVLEDKWRTERVEALPSADAVRVRECERRECAAPSVANVEALRVRIRLASLTTLVCDG